MEIISVLYRSFQCLYLIAGHIDKFYSIINKHKISFLHDDILQVKNRIFLDNLIIFPPNLNYISKTAVYDLCQIYGYDNIWCGSSFFGQHLCKLTTYEEEEEEGIKFITKYFIFNLDLL